MSVITHIPVLLSPFLRELEQLGPVENYLDCTFGRGGHAAEVLTRFPACRMFAFDQDDEAIEFGKTEFPPRFGRQRLEFYHENFMQPESLVKNFPAMDLILADLGVSSPQYDQASRGFSFQSDGPLDMRMDRRRELTAADIVNTYSEKELLEIFIKWGELARPHRVVRAIVADRDKQAFRSTRQLASLIERIDGWRKKGSHPATKYFMALRLLVNAEIEPLAAALQALIQLLRPGGSLFVISFHSIEDRIVKQQFKSLETYGKMLYKKVIVADAEELAHNPRARSAKLRIFRRGEPCR